MNTFKGMAAGTSDIQSAGHLRFVRLQYEIQAYGGMLMGFVTIHKGDPIGAAPQPMGVVGMIPLSGGVKDTHAIAQASRSNIGIFIRQKRD